MSHLSEPIVHPEDHGAKGSRKRTEANWKRHRKRWEGSRKRHRCVTDASQKTSQKTSQKIIDLIKEDPYISTSKMAEIIGVDRRNIARNIKKLQEQGAVRRVGPDKGGFWEIIVR